MCSIANSLSMCYKIFMEDLNIVVFNHLFNDSRVIKQIHSLSNNYQINIICLKNRNIPHSDYSKSFKKVNFRFIHFSQKIHKKNLITFIKWQFLIRFQCFKILNKSKGKILANDLETLIPAYFARINNPESIIYDSHEIWTQRQGCMKTVIHKFINFIEYLLECHIVQRIGSIMTISEDIAEYLKRVWQFRGKINIVRNIPEFSEPNVYSISRRNLAIPENMILFVYAGQISSERNSDKLIRAFQSVADKNIGLMLIGRSHIDIGYDISKSENIFHINEIQQSQLINYLRLADIGIHPLNTSSSINHALALPNKLFQYLHAGLALCMYENKAVRQIIDKCKNGLYGNMDNEENIALNIQKIIKEDIISMKKNSDICKINYNWKKDEIILREAVCG